jgi:hypothetical protein
MDRVFVFAFILLPPLLAFGLVVVTRPRWMGWTLWTVAALMAAFMWIRVGNSHGEAGRIFDMVAAIWMTWGPVAALAIKLWPRRTA